jgi:hypothetical protein
MGNPKDRPEQDGGGAALSFDDVLGRLDAAIADMNAIHTKLHTFKVVPELDLRKLPKPGPPKLGVWTGELRPRPSDPTPDQLWAAWKAGGVNWVGGLDRRTARALAQVVAHPTAWAGGSSTRRGCWAGCSGCCGPSLRCSSPPASTFCATRHTPP